ncbi:MAG TPA: anthranilate synthase component I [Thermodesulfovibrionales bacterium]|jgi:anthranilate synthase component 1|nr:anthranilate synthase component I [Thermodesulfovibrionales bacterium]
MVHPDLSEFKRLSGEGNLIPVYREILADMDTPVSAFLKIGGNPSFLLESVVGGEKWARYSFIGSNPLKVIRGWGRKIEIRETGRRPVVLEAEDPLAVLKKELSRYKPVSVQGLPRFSGGLVGYMGYDMVRFFEKIPDMKRPGTDLPDMFFMLTDTMLIFDSLKQKIKIVSNVHVDGKGSQKAYREAVEKIDNLTEKLTRPRTRYLKQETHRRSPRQKRFTSNFRTREAFEDAVARAKEYIAAGDIFQVVLSQRFERTSHRDPFDVYRALRVVNPSPYMYFINTGDAEIVGSSPEVLVRLEGSKVVLRPIAGTRKRGETEAEDEALEEELKRDPKEIAEHIMLVDLGRNDVGRVAQKGSVEVTELMAIERYSHVMHMVSNVEGELEDGLDAFDVLRASFPAGTVTGAPKVRAMEIIEELEPTRRGPYAGAVGYFSYSGNMDTCITIRTLIARANKISVQAGAGIVADSSPEKEYAETVNKAMGMMEAVDIAERGLA